MTAATADPLPLPTGVVSGRVRVPASKSVAQRVLNLALLSGSRDGRPLTIHNPPDDEDSRAFASVLRTLGWSRTEPETAELETTWRLQPPASLPAEATIDCGSSGTALRLLTASLSTFKGTWTVTGSEQLAARPLGGLVAALRAAGVEIETPDDGASLPLEIRGGEWIVRDFAPAELAVDASTSSQYLSALLMAATAAAQPVRVHATGLVSAPYVDLTLDWMRRFGATVERTGDETFLVQPGLNPPAEVTVEGDWSSACYPAAAAALTGGRVVLEGLDPASAQADRTFLDVLERMGAAVAWEGDSVKIEGTGSLTAIHIDMNAMPDQVPTLACLAPFAAGTTTIRGVAHLRHKESDRLAVVARELGRLGAEVEELDDGLRIPGVWSTTAPPEDPVTVDPQGDHRIAMAVAVLAARRPGVRMRDLEVVEKSYRGFWQQWAHLTSGSGDYGPRDL